MKIKGLTIYIFLIVICFSNAYAEIAPAKSVNFKISRDSIQSKIEILQAKKGIDEASKARELNWYQLADENIANQQWSKFLITSYQEILAGASKKLKKKSKADKKTEQTLYRPNDTLASEELEIQIVNLKQKLRSVSDALSKLETEFNQYTNRPQKIREEILIAQQGLEKVQSEINVPRGINENKYEFEAHQIYLTTLIDTLSTELKKLALEAETNPVQIQLNKQTQDELREQKARLNFLLDEREKLLEQQSLEKAKKLQQDLIKAESESEYKYPAVQQMIRDNIQWSLDLQEIINATNKHNHDIEEIVAYKKIITDNHKHAEKKIKLAGLSPALGRVLREQRRNLANDKLKYQSNVNIQDEANLISLAQYKVEAQQNKLRDLQTEVDSQVKIVERTQAADFSSDDLQAVTQEIETLLSKEDHLLDELSDAYVQGLRVLGNYEFSKQQLLTEINQYESYLDERLLWVPSSLPLSLNYPLTVYKSTHWLLSPMHWIQSGQELLAAITDSPFTSALAAIIWLILIYLQPYLKNKKLLIAEQVKKHYSDKIGYTFQALLFDFLIVIPIPFLLFSIGYLFRTLPFKYEFSRAVGTGLFYAALVLLILQFFTKLLERNGVAALHFKWSEQTVTFLRNQIAWMRFIIIPSMFIIHMTVALSVNEHSDSLGRLALLIFMLVLTFFFIQLLRPSKCVFSHYFKSHPTRWWVKLRYLWFIGVICIPLVIMGFALMGYYVSALELHNKVIISMRIIFIAIIVHSLIIRWLTLTKRKMALKNALQKRKTQEINEKQAEQLSNEEILIQEEELLDIPKINEQTINIVNISIVVSLLVSLWLVWKTILPAFSFLDTIVLWQHSTVVDNQEIFQATTLNDLLLAGLYVFIIVNAVINFPGVMEILLFRNMQLEAGTRYAIIQLTKYALVSIGFISIANLLGGSWSQVQWLVAALSVGLGFGLQEIFANMVSGVILLFERPIRVGDTVTIDDISGKVTRIQMRATTITDWDAKELIVPNKSFITNKLVNWTLTDSVTRVVIPLGISYGADVEVAHKIILETISSAPLVLKDPEPSVMFLEFGDSSLNFSIRVHVSELGHRLPVTHDLHMRLLAALRKEGIEIPFPQRDLHVRSVDAVFPVSAG